MKGTPGVLLRRPLVVTTLLLAVMAGPMTSVAGASSTTTTLTSAQKTCGVVPNPSVRIVSSGSTCVLSLRLGGTVRIKLRSGFRWGFPVSNSRAVKVAKIFHGSMGVDAVSLRAAAVGRATIRTTGTIYCKPGVACPDLALLWTLRVIVTSSSST